MFYKNVDNVVCILPSDLASQPGVIYARHHLEQNSSDKDFILGFLQHVPSKVSIAEWTKELEEKELK